MSDIDTPDQYPKTIHTPSGNWITLRDWRQLLRGDKRRVIAQIQDGNGFTQGHDITSGLLILLAENWSYQLPLPKVSSGSLDLLPLEDDAALAEAVAPARRAIFPPAAATPAQEQEQKDDDASPTTGDGA
jgi:hypothetical protein